MTNLSHFNIRHLREGALKGSTAGSIHAITEAVHPLDKVVKTAGVWRGLTAEESLVRHSSHQFAGNEEIGLLAQFLYKLVSRRAVENVVFNGHILIIQLRHQAERWHIGNAMTKSCLTEFRCQVLQKVTIISKDKLYSRGHGILTFNSRISFAVSPGTETSDSPLITASTSL